MEAANVEATDTPTEWPRGFLDATELPLLETLSRFAEMDDDSVLVQVNDRAPQYLYPKLEERGYSYDTAETDEGVLTAIWREL